ncbi:MULTISPECIES: rod shape-determining protein MreD [Pacificimonas]|nr:MULTISPECIES: rod shape-determining protein MreD [Pacificimonas]MBZ6379163.1 rod shape-determining protein MreD [Pacificimonas aurantium]
MVKADRPFRSLSTGEQVMLLVSGLFSVVPFLVALLAFLIGTIPLFPPIALVPNVGLVLMFLFALYRPSQLPVWAAVPLGVAVDLLHSFPLGVHAVALPLFMLAVQWVDSKTRRLHWFGDWLISIPFIMAGQALLWLLSIVAGPSVPLLPFLTQGLTSIAIFPFVAFLFVSVQRRFVDRISS